MAYLQSTLRSVLAQTNTAYSVVIATHDDLELPELAHPAVQVLKVTTPVPARTNDDMCVDKAIKLTAGIAVAKQQGAEHVMLTDADDLVSRRLTAFVASARGGSGWYFTKGYSYSPAGRALRSLPDFYKVCGTSGIFRVDALHLAPSEMRPDMQVIALAEQDHAAWPDMMAAAGTPIRPLPFAGAIYVRHDDSLSSIPGGRGYTAPPRVDGRPAWLRTLSRIKHGALDLTVRRPITAAVREEFTL